MSLIFSILLILSTAAVILTIVYFYPITPIPVCEKCKTVTCPFAQIDIDNAIATGKASVPACIKVDVDAIKAVAKLEQSINDTKILQSIDSLPSIWKISKGGNGSMYTSRIGANGGIEVPKDANGNVILSQTTPAANTLLFNCKTDGKGQLTGYCNITSYGNYTPSFEERYTIISGKDLPGNDVGSKINVTDPALCAVECDKLANCKGFTIATDQNASAGCYLKSIVGTGADRPLTNSFKKIMI